MPLPLILAFGALFGAAAYDAKKNKDAKETYENAESRHKNNIKKFEIQKDKTVANVKELENKEIEVVNSFEEFQRVFESIHNRPVFKSYQKTNVSIPQYSQTDFKKFKPLDLPIMATGIYFNGFLNAKYADKAHKEVLKAEIEINKICDYLANLSAVANEYLKSLKHIESVYKEHLYTLKKIVFTDQKQDWNLFTEEEKLITENTVLLVGLLYEMCKVQIVLKSDNKDDLNTINYNDIDDNINKAVTFLKEISK